MPPENTNKIYDNFRHAEHLAHVVAYDALLDKKNTKKTKINGVETSINESTIKILDEDNVERSYNIKRVKTSNAGLVCNVLYTNQPDNPRIHVIFRGTHNIASARRDIEAVGFGPGCITFKENQAEILRTIKGVVSHKLKNSKRIVVNVAGHSLGGADAQMCATEILGDMAHKSNNNPLAQIAELNILHANSPGVPRATSRQAIKYAREVKLAHPKLNISQYILHVGSDSVQQGGYESILSGAEHDTVNTHLLRADIDSRFARFADALLLFGGQFFAPANGFGLVAAVIVFAQTGLSALVKTGVYHRALLLQEKQENWRVKIRVLNNKHSGDAAEIKEYLGEHKIFRKTYKTYKTITSHPALNHVKNVINKIGAVKNINPSAITHRVRSLASTISGLPKPAKISTAGLRSTISSAISLISQIQTTSTKQQAYDLSAFMDVAKMQLQSLSKLATNADRSNTSNLKEFNAIITNTIEGYEKYILPYIEKMVACAKTTQEQAPETFKQITKNYGSIIGLTQDVLDSTTELYALGQKFTDKERIYAATGTILSVAGIAMQAAAMVHPALGISMKVAVAVNWFGCQLCRKAMERLNYDPQGSKLKESLNNQAKSISALEKVFGFKSMLSPMYALNSKIGSDKTKAKAKPIGGRKVPISRKRKKH